MTFQNSFEHIVSNLQSNIPTFQSLLQVSNSDLIHYKPTPEKWNILEVICHLYDEERELLNSVYQEYRKQSIGGEFWRKQRGLKGSGFKATKASAKYQGSCECKEQITADIRMVSSVKPKAIAAASLGLHLWAMPKVETVFYGHSKLKNN